MTERLEEELELLRTEYPDLDHRRDNGIEWIRIPSYPIPEEIWGRPEVEVAFHIPPHAGQAPYAFRVRPSLVLKNGAVPTNYTYPVPTPWGDDWGQFSWAPLTAWIPTDDLRAGANMLTFARSFAQRLREGN